MGRLPSRGSDQFPLRLPDGMRDRIKVAAAENGRSMNAEIVSRLEASFPRPLVHLKSDAEDDEGTRAIMNDYRQRAEKLASDMLGKLAQDMVNEMNEYGRRKKTIPPRSEDE